MPALESFSISACSLNTNVFPLDYSRPFLKHVKFERTYSGPILERAHVDGVQIIEARGTPLEHTIMQALYGISSLSESQQHLLTHLDLRLICSKTEPSSLEYWYAGEVASWFAMLPKGSLPNLEVLFILVPLRGPYINYFLDKISAGKLKTLWFGMRWDALCQCGHAALYRLAEFRSLEEIFLPCSGDDFTVIFDLARAPRLAHVHFQIEINIDATGQIAKRCGAFIKTLQTVSWVNQMTISLERDTEGKIIRMEFRAYEEPAWLEFGTAASGW
ncbi:uncharacterized protein EV420DRAFT_1550885 [Desarmillaria tabescens]|uniref:Uncharacterized protein n=1 Tax=Armillaria tabescens TaxID=1929756 RepID=A0AA39KA12_ARMTA|nr:uncharacterized protein EV420DRAFT_1550885 [Desarmillaria tabescens]KAK0457013.1 hypothetical protein EV420DRAFT_1550885 [Desarmillaria tabescens]